MNFKDLTDPHKRHFLCDKPGDVLDAARKLLDTMSKDHVLIGDQVMAGLTIKYARPKSFEEAIKKAVSAPDVRDIEYVALCPECIKAAALAARDLANSLDALAAYCDGKIDDGYGHVHED